MTEETFNVAPEPLSKADFRFVLAPYLAAMRGIGYMLALAADDDEDGWDQTNCFDFPPVEVMFTGAAEELRAFAKAHQLFYNNDKLEKAATQAFIEAYGDAFIQQRRKMEAAS